MARPDVDARRLAYRVEVTFDALDGLDPQTASTAIDAVEALVELYGEAFDRIVGHVTHAPRDELLGALTQDEVVGHVLIAHGLLPAPPELLDVSTSPNVETPVVLHSRKPARDESARERCELCAAPIDDDHPHLLDVEAGSVQCACRACALLFDRSAASNGRLRRIPARRLALPAPSDGGRSAWSTIGVPVQISFVVVDDDGAPTIRYPGPAGITHADVDEVVWTDLIEEMPELAQLEPEVEALLIRDRGNECTRHLVPIDDCFRLVALMRKSWVGITGGPDMWAAVDGWFDDLAAHSRMLVHRGPSGGHDDPKFEANGATRG